MCKQAGDLSIVPTPKTKWLFLAHELFFCHSLSVTKGLPGVSKPRHLIPLKDFQDSSFSQGPTFTCSHITLWKLGRLLSAKCQRTNENEEEACLSHCCVRGREEESTTLFESLHLFRHPLNFCVFWCLKFLT